MGTRKRLEDVKDLLLLHEQGNSVSSVVTILERANCDMRKLRTVRRSKLDMYSKVEDKLRSFVSSYDAFHGLAADLRAHNESKDPMFCKLLMDTVASFQLSHEEREDIEDSLASYDRLDDIENLLLLRLACTLDSLEVEAQKPQHSEEGEAARSEEGEAAHSEEGEAAHSEEGEAAHSEEGEAQHSEEGGALHYGTRRKVRWYWAILLLILLSLGAGQCF